MQNYTVPHAKEVSMLTLGCGRHITKQSVTPLTLDPLQSFAIPEMAIEF